MKKKILITGISSSFIQKLSLQIKLSEYDVTGISRNPPSSDHLNSIKIIKEDLLNIQNTSKLFKDCHMIIHGAAITHSKKEKAYYKMNLQVTKKLVLISKKYKIARFIFISSNTANINNGAYSKSKLLAEQYIKKNTSNWIIIRLSEIYGSNKKEGIDGLINNAINKSIIFCPINIPFKLYPIHVKDATKLSYNKIFQNKESNKMYVINGNEGYSFYEIINLIEKITEKKIKIIFLNRAVMFIIKWLTKCSPINFSIVPDQIDRLYGEKCIENNNNDILGLKNYIKQLIKK